jgi:hypothetical protein
VEELSQLRSQAAELVGLVADNATAGGFKTYADEEKGIANNWRLVSVLATVGIVAAGISFGATRRITSTGPELALRRS